MRPLTPGQQELAESLALRLADVYCMQVPALFAEPPELIVGITLPVAKALVASEVKAARYKRDARRYRALRRRARAAAAGEEPVAALPVRAGGPA